jgi:hypothetical protein
MPSLWTIDDLRERRFAEMRLLEAVCAECGETRRMPWLTSS